MRKSSKAVDKEKTNIIIGIVVLFALVTCLVSSVVLLNLRTGLYLNELEQNLTEIEIQHGDDSSCPLNVLQEAAKTADGFKFDIKEVKIMSDDETEYINPDDPTEPPSRLYSWGLEISLSNIKKNYIISVKNDINDEKYTLRYEDMKDGKFSFETADVLKFANYTFDVYYEGKSCEKELVKKVVLRAPRYNFLSEVAACSGKEDLADCKKFIYDKEGESSGYSETVEKLQSKDEEELKIEEEKAKTQTNLTIIYIIVAVLMVASLIVVVVGLLKIRKGGVLHANEIETKYDENVSEAFDEFDEQEKSKNKSKNK